MKKILLTLWMIMGGICANAQTLYSLTGPVTPFGYAGDGGKSRLSRSNEINAMTVDKDNNIYYCDRYNHRIRRIDAITGIVTTVAGSGTIGPGNGGFADGPATSARFNEPWGLGFDQNFQNLYVADYYNSRIRKINLATSTVSTILGNGTAAYGGNNGAASAATTEYPTSVAVDRNGNIYFGAEDYTIRRIDVSTNVVTLFAGDPNNGGLTTDNVPATSTRIGRAQDIKIDAIGNLYFANWGGNNVFKIIMATGYINRVAGLANGFGGTPTPGPATSSTLSGVCSIGFDRFGNLYIGSFDYYLLKVSPGGILSFVAGTGVSSAMSTPAECGPALSTPLGAVLGITVDYHGNIIFADGNISRIYVMSTGSNIVDVDLNTLCKTGFSSPAVTPAFTVTAAGGVPPYTYTWTPQSGNNAALSSTTSANPSVTGFSGGNVAKYALTITDDGSTTCKTSASRNVQATFKTAATYDLAMRDSWYDMYDEANTQNTVNPGQWQIWDSPDLWNRIYNDGNNKHQNPCSGSCTNYMFTTVRNVGCVASPSSGANLKFYWTLGGAPETWPGDWTTNNYGSTGLPQGRQITTLPVSALNPGAKQQYRTSWTPPTPSAYHAGAKEMEVCFLARITDGHNPLATDGMTIQEGSGLSANVNNNNNVVTRNTSVIAVSNYSPRVSYLVIGNGTDIAQTYSLQLMNDNLNTSTLDKFLTVSVRLSGEVFERWLAEGAKGTYSSIDPGTRSVIFDGKNTMQLDGIPFQPNETTEVELAFTMNEYTPDGEVVDGTKMQNEVVHFRQLTYDDEGTASVYGNYSYELLYDGYGEQGSGLRGTNPAANGNITKQNKNTAVRVYPNPAHSNINFGFADAQTGMITLTDIAGRIVANKAVNNETTVNMDVKGLATGFYLYRVQAGSLVKTGKIFIQK